jgi:UDP-N-acetylmuramoylalanine--D-glutamate ligase
MIDLSRFADRRIAVMGLARSGLASVSALAAAGAEVLAWDDNAARRAEAAKLGATVTDLAAADWSGIDLAVWSPGIPHSFPVPHPAAIAAKAAGVALVCDIELLALANPQARFVGITGTNGKSTTTALVGHILTQAGRKAEAGGNLGMAALTLAPLGADGIYVLELSSYQIELLREARFDVAALLNITPDHLDRHGTLEHYAAVKERLIAGSRLAVVGVDDAISAAVADRAERAGTRVRRISARHPVADGIHAEGSVLWLDEGGAQSVFADLAPILSLRGSHNAQNACAAVAACLALGLSADEIRAGLASFPGLDHRMEMVARAGRVLFVNDSKATNADAAERALASYSRIYWIAGGRAKEGGIDALAPHFRRVRHAYLIGESTDGFAATLDGKLAYSKCGTLQAALAAAAKDARGTGGVVLLSPAAASFDQFDNFEQRGDCFRDLVKALAQDAAATVTGGAA